VCYQALCSTNLITDVHIDAPDYDDYDKMIEDTARIPEVFEKERSAKIPVVSNTFEEVKPTIVNTDPINAPIHKEVTIGGYERSANLANPYVDNFTNKYPESIVAQQGSLFKNTDSVLQEEYDFKIIGQAFETFWIMEYKDKLYIIDQHAAHEKVMYEKFLKRFDNNEKYSQNLMPPVVVSLNTNEENALNNNLEVFERFGFVVEHFGGKEYTIRAVPFELCGVRDMDFFRHLLDRVSDLTASNCEDLSRPICEHIATMACKAAIKGNDPISILELKELIKELFTLDNPYNCPHGRPTTISITKYELEKKFKRIVSES